LVCRSPTFCADVAHDKEFQCREKNSFGLIVHGLWPQTSGTSSVQDHPRNCRNEQQLPFSIIKRFYCMMPDEDLMQAEWEKHGKIIHLSQFIEKKTLSYRFLLLCDSNRLFYSDRISVQSIEYT